MEVMPAKVSPRMAMIGTGEMVQWVGALAALPEDLSLIPSNQHGGPQPSVTLDPNDPTLYSGLYAHCMHINIVMV